MLQAYSRLKRILSKHKMTVPELRRRIRESGVSVTLKSLYRLNDAAQPLERLDLRLAGAICRACRTQLSDWIVFQKSPTKLRRLSVAKQHRLDGLLEMNRDSRLSGSEREELQALVRETEELSLQNARTLTARD
jgi:hypothetical protein